MRWRLALLVAATTSIVVAAFLVPLALEVRDLAAARAVTAATDDAQNVAALVGVVTDQTQLQDVLDRVNSSGRQTSVRLPDGTVLGPTLHPSPSLSLAMSGRAFTASTGDGREILVPVEMATGRAVVRTLVPGPLLRRGVPQALGILALLGTALIVVAVVVADRLARWTIRPVGALAETARRLAHGDLTARVRAAGPHEVVEVCIALNGLAARIGELLAGEREAVADLSHRLRTPLTALRLEAHALADPTESARVLALVDTVQRTVDRIIYSARRPVREGAGAASDLVDVVGRRVEFWSALAEDQGREVALSMPAGPQWVRLPTEDLEALVDALLENVFAHTPEGCGFAVWVDPEAAGATSLVVADSGPGLPDRGDVTRRGVSDRGSTGLGLDIVRRTAEASGGGPLRRRAGRAWGDRPTGTDCDRCHADSLPGRIGRFDGWGDPPHQTPAEQGLCRMRCYGHFHPT